MHITIQSGRKFFIKGTFCRLTYELPDWVILEMNRPDHKINLSILQMSRKMFGSSNKYYQNLSPNFDPALEFLPPVLNIFWIESDGGANPEIDASELILALFSDTTLLYNNYEGLIRFLDDFDWDGHANLKCFD
jgi:hypothetical protein